MNNQSYKTVEVKLGKRSYEILIGANLIKGAGLAIDSVVPGARVAIITDSNVGPLHLETLTTSLDKTGIDWLVIEIPAGEKSKCMDCFNNVV